LNLKKGNFELEVTLNFGTQNKVNGLQTREPVTTQENMIPEIQGVVLDSDHQEHVARQLIVQNGVDGDGVVLVVEETVKDEPVVPEFESLRSHLVDTAQGWRVQQHLDVGKNFVKPVQ